MSDLHQSLIGRRCRKGGSDATVPYHYRTVAVWVLVTLAGWSELMCGVVSVTGASNVMRFMDLEFEP